MIDTYQNQTIKINAVSGGIVRNYKDSFFLRFHLKSPLAEQLLDEEPRYSKRKVVVLQLVICGDMEVIAELMFKSDFDELFMRGEENGN